MVPSQITIPYFDSVYYNRFNEAKEKGEDFFATKFTFEEKNRFYQKLFKHIPELPEKAKEFYFSCPGLAASTVLLENVSLYIENFSGTPYTDEENNTLMRFGKVFQQTYTRFLDLQKAEAQARESQIQLALERARSQSMTMQRSAELDDTLRVFHEQVLQLGIPSAFSFLWLPDEEKDRHIFWAAWAENNSTVFKSKAINYPLDRNEPATAQCLIDWKGNEPVVSYHVPPTGVENYFAAWSELIAGVDELKPENFREGLYYVEAFIRYGCFGVMVKTELQQNEKKILQRFAVEFEATYTRFLDLQKAEAQAREAQIELGLERVRARAMAMQKSDELAELVETVFKELTKLDFSLTRCIIMIMDDGLSSCRWWMANSETDKTPESFYIKCNDHPYWKLMFKAWEERNPKWVYDLKGSDKKTLDDYLFSETELSHLPQPAKSGMMAEERIILSQSFHNFGCLLISSFEPLTENQLDILYRFTKAFDLTYTRFNDLQKAEAQAREAQIEAALERVRARTMAMHKSEELAETAAVLFQQFNVLGNSPERINIGIVKEEKGIIEYWATDQNGHQINHRFNATIEEPTTIAKVYAGWKENKRSMVVDLKGDELKEWMRYLLKELKMPFKEELIHDRRIHTVAFFSQGMLLTSTPEPFPAEALNLLERFADVFNLTYRRFLDLQRAEAQAREATIEAALEKVRGMAMAMHNSNDLTATASLVFTELRKLGISPIRCGVGLLNRESRKAQLYAATSSNDGDSLSLVGWVELSGHPVLEKIYDTWLKNEDYYPELIGEELTPIIHLF